MCHKLILQLVISHLDYANSMLAGLPTSSIKIMQKIQNTAVGLILGKKYQRKHHRGPKIFTLVTNTTKDRLQNMYCHPLMSQRKRSIISSKCNTRKKKKQTVLDSDGKTRMMF